MSANVPVLAQKYEEVFIVGHDPGGWGVNYMLLIQYWHMIDLMRQPVI